MVLMLDGARSAPQSFEDLLQWLDLFGNIQHVPKRPIAHLVERISADLLASPIEADNAAIGTENDDRTSGAFDDGGSEVPLLGQSFLRLHAPRDIGEDAFI